RGCPSMADRIRFYTDEHIDKAVAAALRQHGADVRRFVDMTPLGTDDPLQFTRAIHERRVVVTRDRDFLRLAAGGREHSGILFATPRTGLKRIIRRAVALFNQHDADYMRN